MPLMNVSSKQRSMFENALFAGLGPQLKGTGWKKNKCALYMQSGDYYQDVFISVHRNAMITSVELRFKPMSLDPILWDILDIPGNLDEPLSFRTWGAFTCSGVPILKAQIEQPGNSAKEVGATLISFCENNRNFYQECLATNTYSELVSNHPNQVERGAYATTLVISLINDHNYIRARQVANSYFSGELSSSSELTRYGKSFHQLAVEWLDAGNASLRKIHSISEA